MILGDQIQNRGIAEVIHFTTNRGLVGVLARQALLSRHRLRDDQLLKHVAYPNTQFRQEDNALFDKEQRWIDYVSLSLTDPNLFFFRKSRNWHLDQDIYWVVLSFDADLILHGDVYFATTNNVYECCRRGRGVAGLEALFERRVARKRDWVAHRTHHASNQPTCQQAEVLYPRELGAEFLRTVYVRNRVERIYTKATLAEYDRADVEVVIDPAKFGETDGND